MILSKESFVVLGLLTSSLLFSQVIVDDWQFNDGTTLTTTTNDGTSGIDWRANGTGFSVGGGALTANGSTSGGVSAWNGNFPQPSPVAELTNPGIFSYEISFSSWDLSDFTGAGNRVFSFSTQSYSTPGVAGGDSLRWGRVQLVYTGSGTASITADADNSFVTIASGLALDNSTTPTAQTVRVEVNLLEDTIEYFLNDVSVYTGADVDAASRIDNVALSTATRYGTGAFDQAGAFVNVDYITSSYTVVPESSAFAWLAGTGYIALSAMLRRR